MRGEFYFIFLFFLLCAFATRREEEKEEEEECVLRAGMMRPNRGFILLLLNGTACLVRKEFFFLEGVGWGGVGSQRTLYAPYNVMCPTPFFNVRHLARSGACTGSIYAKKLPNLRQIFFSDLKIKT